MYFKKDWSELFKNNQIDLTCSTPSTILIGDSIAAGLGRFSNVWHNFFRNALNRGIGGDRTEQVVYRVDKLSFPASIKCAVIDWGTNNIRFNNPTNTANDILCIYFPTQSKLPMHRLLLPVFPPEAKNICIFIE